MSSQTLITCSLWMKISQPDMMVSPFRQFKSAMNSSLQWSAVIALGKRRCYVTAAVSWKLHFKLTKQKLPKSEFIFQPESRWRRVGDKGLKSRREILPKAISVLFPYNLTSTADFFCFSSVGKQIFTYVRMWEFFQQKCFDSLLARAAHHIFASFFSWRKRRAARPNVMSLAEIKSAILLTKSAWGFIDCRTIQLSSVLLDAQTIKIYLVILKLEKCSHATRISKQHLVSKWHPWKRVETEHNCQHCCLSVTGPYKSWSGWHPRMGFPLNQKLTHQNISVWSCLFAARNLI